MKNKHINYLIKCQQNAWTIDLFKDKNYLNIISDKIILFFPFKK